MEELNFENILSDEDMEGLFLDASEEALEEESTKEENNAVETNPDEGSEEESENVDSEESYLEEGDETDSDEPDENVSPKTNFYSSIATALRDEGILPDLDDTSLKNITDAEAFAKAMESHIESRLDEREKRISEALNYNVERSDIQKYEQTLSYLDSISSDAISDESEEGETLRRQIITQDYINRGFSPERAKREVDKSFKAGADLEDAKEALESNKDYFSDSYKALINEKKKADQEIVSEQKKQKEALKKSLLEDKEVFTGVSLDKKTRQQVWDNLTKAVHKDEDGHYYSAIQKYEKENKSDFMKKIGVLFTLTDGFKDIDKLVNKRVGQEKKKAIRDLEKVLKSNSTIQGGALDFMSGVSGEFDKESNINFDLLDI